MALSSINKKVGTRCPRPSYERFLEGCGFALGASNVCLVVKTRQAPSRHSRDARVYGHTTTAMHKLSTPPPVAPLSVPVCTMAHVVHQHVRQHSNGRLSVMHAIALSKLLYTLEHSARSRTARKSPPCGTAVVISLHHGTRGASTCTPAF